MEYVTLNNGVKMPKLGYGVYQIDPAGRLHSGYPRKLLHGSCPFRRKPS